MATGIPYSLLPDKECHLLSMFIKKCAVLLITCYWLKIQFSGSHLGLGTVMYFASLFKKNFSSFDMCFTLEHNMVFIFNISILTH